MLALLGKLEALRVDEGVFTLLHSILMKDTPRSFGQQRNSRSSCALRISGKPTSRSTSAWYIKEG